jgi:hypothetical protein
MVRQLVSGSRQGGRASANRNAVTSETLSEIASAHNLLMTDGDAEDYLFLLNSLDATVDQVSNLPAYIDPRLLPDEKTLPRSFTKPTDNLQGAWSHQVCWADLDEIDLLTLTRPTSRCRVH